MINTVSHRELILALYNLLYLGEDSYKELTVECQLY